MAKVFYCRGNRGDGEVDIFHTFAFSGCSTFSSPNHAINHFRQTIVALIDGSPKSPTSRNFPTHNIECQHFTFPFDIDDATFLYNVPTFRQNLKKKHSNQGIVTKLYEGLLKLVTKVSMKNCVMMSFQSLLWLRQQRLGQR